VQKPSSKSRRAPTQGALGVRDRRAALALILGVGLLLGLGLGTRDLWAPDEPRYGAIAEELRSFRQGPSGLLLLHLNGRPYTQKPPLYFWLAALAGLPSDRVDELAARLPSALAGIGCVGLTALIGRWLLGHAGAALLAAGLLATSFRFVWSARRVQLDVLLTFFELVAITLFLWLELRRGGVEEARAHPGALVGLHAALGAGAMVKGPVAWLPLLVFAAYLAWEGRLPAFRKLLPGWSGLLCVGPVLLWITSAVALAPAGFAESAVIENLIERFFAGSSHARPLYYYAYQLPLDFLPWTVLLPAALPVVWSWTRSERPGCERPSAGPDTEGSRLASQTRSAGRFLLVWIGIPLLFFSLSAGKRGLYLLPIFPALALVGVVAGTGLRREKEHWNDRRAARLARAGLGVALVELALFVLILPQLHGEKSPRPVAVQAASGLGPGEPIGVYAMRPIEGGIAYYGDHPVHSLETPGNLCDFLASGGQRVILRTRHLERLAAPMQLLEITRLRGGRRSLSIAGPAPTESTPAPSTPQSREACAADDPARR